MLMSVGRSQHLKRMYMHADSHMNPNTHTRTRTHTNMPTHEHAHTNVHTQERWEMGDGKKGIGEREERGEKGEMTYKRVIQIKIQGLNRAPSIHHHSLCEKPRT